MANNILRVVKYRRVSSDEQKLHGFSLDAQDETLNDFLQNNPNMRLVGEFSDEGISGHSPLKKRKGLMEIIEMAKNKEIDLIIFTKLDRFFRNVGLYHEANNILEKHGVSWQAVSEDYETVTAAGKFKVNIMLSVAQQERDTGSERISAVFEYKVRNGHAISAKQPMGFMVKPDHEGIKRVVKDPETEPVVDYFFEQLRSCHSVKKAGARTNRRFEMSISNKTYQYIVDREQYAGCYRGNLNYCPQYITMEEHKFFLEMKSRNMLKSNTRRERSYLFSGLLYCPECGRRLSGGWQEHKGKKARREYYGYRCPRARLDKTCDWHKRVSEMRMEAYLLENIKLEIEKVSSADVVAIEKEKVKIEKQVKSVKDEMNRLNNMYLKGRIDENKYEDAYIELEKELRELNKLEAPKVIDTEPIKELFEGDFEALYRSLSREEQQVFWRTIIDKIEVNDDATVKRILFK